MSGTLYGVGVGPGDPELLTVKAARLISTARYLFYLSANGGQSLARSIAAPYLSGGATEIAIDMPMRPEPEIAARIYDDCSNRIADVLGDGHDVVMLCEGDPLFYASFSYVLERLQGRHSVVAVPGITSLSASAMVLNRPLTQRNDVLKVLPATLPDDRLRAELEQFDTAAIIKTGRHMPRILALLKAINLIESSVAVERASQPGQRIFALSEMTSDNVSYFTTVIVQRKESR